MKARTGILLFALVGLPLTSAGAGVEGISLSHFEHPQRLLMQSGDAGGQQKPGSLGPIEMSFDALGRSFTLELEPNANVLAALEGRDRTGGAIPYRGRIQGVDGSWARIVIANGMPSGIIADGNELFALEAPGDAVVSTDIPIIYKLDDALVAPGALSCASGVVPATGSAVFDAVVSGLESGFSMSQAAGATTEISLGVVADKHFTNDKGADAENAIMRRVNNVDGIFSEQLGVQIRVGIIETYGDADDPLPDTLNPSGLLDALGLYRRNTPSQRSQGLTHLYTGRNLEGSTVGIAYQGEVGQGGGLVLCNTRYGAGLSEGNGSAYFDSLVTAHELGHNFGAPHDGSAGTACADQQGSWLMSPRVSDTDQFSPCSIQQMQDDIAAASCITDLAGTDISLAFRGSAATALLGGSDNVVIDIVNNGIDPSRNVVVDITLPGNVTLNSATSPAGGCQSGAGSVSCQLGDVAGSAATAIDLDITGSVVGSDTLSATVTADVDDQAGNNQDALQLTVDPAVNLAINTLPSSQVTLNGSTTLTVTFDNRAALDATGVTLNIALNAGLRANSASWSIGSCSVAAQQVDCQASQFDRQSSASLTLNVSGIAEGTKNYSVTLASAEADTDASDNSVQGSVRVNAPGGGGGGGADAEEGGGSAGWLLLTLLAGLSTRRALRIRRPAG